MGLQHIEKAQMWDGLQLALNTMCTGPMKKDSILHSKHISNLKFKNIIQNTETPDLGQVQNTAGLNIFWYSTTLHLSV